LGKTSFNPGATGLRIYCSYSESAWLLKSDRIHAARAFWHPRGDASCRLCNGVSMIRINFVKSTFALLLFAIVFGFGQSPANAQATFQVSSSATTITKIGHTELVGFATFTVASGTTQAGTMEFFIPNVQITNDTSSGIAITGTGGLATATIASVIGDNGIVIINIPAGAGTGASATLSGVRISAVGKTFSTLDAFISPTGNSIFAGQNSVRIVRGVADGLTVDSSSQTIVTVNNGVVVVAPAAFIVTEGWERAFSSAIGQAGQTKKTQVIFKAIGLPDNVSLTFPSPVTSNTGATLVTLSGMPEALTNQSSSQRVVYEFNDSATSPTTIDSFSITPTFDFTGTPGTGTAVIQAALGPIGAAVPDTTSPSTAIPRFAELFLPPLSSIPNAPPVTTTLTLSVPGSIDDETITISNTGSGGAIATIRARREDGTLSTGSNLTNEVTRNLSSRQTTTVSLKDLFGPGATVSGISAVDVVSESNGLVVDSIGSAGGRRFGNPRMQEGSVIYVPFDRRTSTDIPLLTLHDTSNSSSNVSITLRTSAGGTVSTAQRTVSALGAVRESFSTLFPSISLPLEGYIVIKASSAVRSLLINNPASRPDEITTLFSVSNSPTVFPFFAFGGGYSTVLQLINPSDTQGERVILAAYSTNGTSLSAQPYIQTLAASEKRNFDFASIFAIGSATVPSVGYFSLALESLIVSNPFANGPQVFGVVRIGTSAFSTVIPFSADVGGQFYLTPAAETSSTYTGLAIANLGSSAASVTVDAFSASGTSLGTTTFSLNSNTARIQLLRELIPQALNNDNVLVRITSTPATVRLVSFRGTLDGNELIYLNPETTP
jgi:hypothetical protein